MEKRLFVARRQISESLERDEALKGKKTHYRTRYIKRVFACVDGEARVFLY